jgi:hypothetical protein
VKGRVGNLAFSFGEGAPKQKGSQFSPCSQAPLSRKVREVHVPSNCHERPSKTDSTMNCCLELLIRGPNRSNSGSLTRLKKDLDAVCVYLNRLFTRVNNDSYVMSVGDPAEPNRHVNKRRSDELAETLLGISRCALHLTHTNTHSLLDTQRYAKIRSLNQWSLTLPL